MRTLIFKEIEDLINPEDVHFPQTQLVSIEDTVNKGGGAVYDFEEINKIKAVCLKNNLPLHLDGARIFNALTENGVPCQTYGAEFDSISICLSKGLGAPVGSILVGNKDFIKKSRRVRKVFGGGMRQAGLIAAGGLYALKNNVERLKVDHQNAKALESTLITLDWVKEVVPVESNIVVVILKDQEKRDLIINKLLEVDIKIMAFGPGMLRFVTHLDISDSQINKTIDCLLNLSV